MDVLEKQRIKPVFQPIVCLKTGEIIGYEALSRIIEPKEISSSEELFHLAGIYGKVWELEQLCRGKILEKYRSFHRTENKKLFLNVNPMVIHDKEFRAGSCYSGLNLICDIVPHYLKLDILLIHDIHKDAIKYAMVKSMVEFANLANIQLVAEGIECEEELKALLKLGVHNGQGYFLRKPDEELKGVEKAAIEVIHKYNDKKTAKLQEYNTETKEFRAVLFKFESYKAYGAYCEKYGDENGDKIIEVMQNVVEQNLSEEETAILLGEDNILTILEKHNYKFKCEIIANMFKNRMQEYYQKEDLEKGYIEGKNKHGEKKKYPLINICSERVV